MRRILPLPALLFSTIGFLDAYTLSLPLDIQSIEQDSQPVNLASVVQNRPQPCSGENNSLNMVNKRQTTNCVAVNCGANDYGFHESPTSENQPVKWSYPFVNQEDSSELPVNLDAESHEILSSEEYNDLDDLPNIFSSSSNEQDTTDQVEASISDIRTDGTFEIAVKKNDPDTTFEQALTFEQDPTTGEPIESLCPLLPEGHPDGYLVHLVEFKAATRRRPQAILLSQHLSTQRYRYDIAPGPGHRLSYRRVINPVFISGGKVVELTRFEQRGWLVSLPDEPVQIALKWFEALARSVTPPRIGTVPNADLHATTIWVTQVFAALAESGSGFWVPLSIPASTRP